ncbi:MAG: RdgB/HAM1 family non-canonical purine NTP pyrophosphatase [Pseudomonadota bacterium]|nr:RdgB/HAM1 family non-canonical purine NTP pyrophosphatase [Pseudomonadota bacterium]
MPRKFIEDRIVIASHNKGKVREISKLLVPHGVSPLSARQLDLPIPEENGKTFVENAEIKAIASAKSSGLPALADDSGLVIPILGGKPGIYSARWTLDGKGQNDNFDYAIRKIKDSIKKIGLNPNGQKAFFTCALSLCWPDEVMISFEGYVHGSLSFPPKGDKGFGYDPIFIPKNQKMTFGEMLPSEKHQISHRADAFNKLLECCFN